MTWITGQRIADELWERVAIHLTDQQLELVANEFIEVFRDNDCDVEGLTVYSNSTEYKENEEELLKDI